MKVFVFCFAILFAVHASPLEVETAVIASKEVVKSENFIDDALVAERVELTSDDMKSSEKIIEDETAENEEPVDFTNDEPAVEQNEESAVAEDETVFHLIDEKPEQVAVPYLVEAEPEENIEGEAFSFDDVQVEDLMTEEERERIFGIDIPICMQYTNDRVALHISHLTDCRKFYKCYNGKAYLMDCPAGHFSVRLDRCDYPETAKCVVDGTHQFKIKKARAVKASAQEKEDDDEDKPEVGEFEIDPRCEGSDPYKPLHFKHPNDCSKFYKCYMGKAYVIKCPRGQQWAQTLNRCEHAQIARCTVAAPVRPGPARPGVRPAQAVEESDEYEYEEEEHVHTIMDDADYMIQDSRCAPDEDDVYHPIQFAHPTDCTMFYKCWLHVAYKSQCPQSLHYNAEANYCDYQYIAKCKAAVPIAVPIEASNKVPLIPSCPQTGTVSFPVEGTYANYFSCENGVVFYRACGEGELFNPYESKCEKVPEFFDMSQLLEMHEMPGMNQNPGMMNQFPGSFQQFPMIPLNPNLPQVQQRPQIPNIQVPQIPNKRPQLVPQTPEFPSWMPVPNQNVPQTLPKPERPILSEKPSHEKPSSELGFNFQNGKENSRCPSQEEPTRPTHLSHETDCNKFYKCFNGRAFMMECPTQQEWSDELQRCDYHQFANCDPVELLKKKIRN